MSGNYETLYAWAHVDRSKPTEYIQIHTDHADTTTPLKIMEEHLVYVQGKASPRHADSIQVGDVLIGVGEAKEVVVTKIRKV
jgi:hypothetical protein